MSWVKLDDQFWSNKKVRRAGDSIAAYVRLLSWCGDDETDGEIPADDVAFICSGLTEVEAKVERLIDVGLLADEGEHLLIPDFLDFNFSAEQLQQKRETERARKEAWRDAKARKAKERADAAKGVSHAESQRLSQRDGQRDGRAESQRPSQQVSRRLSALPDPTRPDPTRPSVITNESEAPAEPRGASEPGGEVVPSEPERLPAKPVDDIDRKLTEHLLDRYAHYAGTARMKASAKALEDMRLLRQRGPTEWATPSEIDHRVIGSMIDWVFDHANTPERGGFCWAKNIQSPASLRKGWLRLITERNTRGHDQDTSAMAIAIGRQLNEGAI